MLRLRMPELRRRIHEQSGVTFVLFAVLLPLILLMGVITVDVGNWWVHQKRAQTLVDAAVFAAGTAFTGCGQDAPAAHLRITRRALEYGGDTGRAAALVPPVTSYNVQEQEPNDLKLVLNSATYWNGSYPPDSTLGYPCAVKFLDAKATDDDVPLLFRLIPLAVDANVHARVEIRQIQATNGVIPVGVPEVDPVRVAVVFVDEDGNANSTSSISGTSFLNKQSLPPGDPLSGMAVWRADVAGVDLNGNENFGAVIVASRNPNMSLTGTLSAICTQVDTQCYSGGTLTSGISFIHSYSDSGSGSATDPFVRQVELAGGCGQSGPYFNLDDGTSCGPILIQAKIDFGASGDPRLDPTCARVSASQGVGAMTWSPGGLGGALGTWTGTFTPAITSVVDFTTQGKKPGSKKPDCSDLSNPRSFQRVAAPYVANDASGPVEHLTLENLPPSPSGFTNSINGNSSANVRVTVGLVPPLRDAPLSDPPIRLRFGTGPSQTQALDCLGSGSGPNGWRGAMVTGCDAFQINMRNGSCATPYPVPPDCIDSQNGNFNSKGVEDRFTPCTPNNWDGVTLPPENDPRWVVLFVLDELAFQQSGKKTYPVRRFASFYVTAGDGMDCPGDNPSTPPVRSREIWGHFASYVIPGFGDTVPKDDLCAFDGAGACVAVLVE